MTIDRQGNFDSPKRPTRRHLLTTGLLAGTSAAAFAVGQRFGGSSSETAHDQQAAHTTSVISPYGHRQPGVTSPDPRQQHVSISVFELDSFGKTPDLLDALGDLVVAAQREDGISGISAGNLTLTVGVGPRVIRHFFSQRSPGSGELPHFKNDDFKTDQEATGDLIVQICADDPTAIALLGNEVAGMLEPECTLNWQAQGFRGAVDQGIGRNLLGFHDGVSVPRTQEAQNDLVWVQEPAPFQNSTVMVVRRMPIDVQSFSALSTNEQERIIGRERKSGTPLSGGALMDDPDLHAKSAAGEFDIPLGAHIRRAHPLPSGAKGLMQRRSYSYFNNPSDQGLLFISFQSELETFVSTQHRMDELDDLMEMTRTTASGSFLVGPGQTPNQGLGAFLRHSE